MDGHANHHGHHNGHQCTGQCNHTTPLPAQQTLEELDFERGPWIAALRRDVTKLKEMLAKDARNASLCDKSGYTPLHYAARYALCMCPFVCAVCVRARACLCMSVCARAMQKAVRCVFAAKLWGSETTMRAVFCPIIHMHQTLYIAFSMGYAHLLDEVSINEVCFLRERHPPPMIVQDHHHQPCIPFHCIEMLSLLPLSAHFRRPLMQFRPTLGTREGRGAVANSDFVPPLGDPQERTVYIAVLPTCGPPRRQG